MGTKDNLNPFCTYIHICLYIRTFETLWCLGASSNYCILNALCFRMKRLKLVCLCDRSNIYLIVIGNRKLCNVLQTMQPLIYLYPVNQTCDTSTRFQYEYANKIRINHLLTKNWDTITCMWNEFIMFSCQSYRNDRSLVMLLGLYQV